MGVSNFDIIQANKLTGAGISDSGKSIYLCTATTDGSYALLQEWGISSNDVYTSLTTAVAALRSGKNDTLYVMPGDHSTAAEVDITQNQVRIVGMSGPNQHHNSTAGVTGICRLKTTTTTIARVLHITGNFVQMENIDTYNNYDAAGNISDVYIVGKNFYAKNCSFRGGNGATQNSGDYGVPLLIASTAYAARFDDCHIGSAGNATRTGGAGYIIFEAGAGGAGMVQFNNCVFAMRSETNGATVSGIEVKNASLDRLLMFNNCVFYNFSENWGAIPDYMMNIDQASTFDILFYGGCGMIGFDTMTDSARAKTSDPLPHTNAVEALALATS